MDDPVVRDLRSNDSPLTMRRTNYAIRRIKRGVGQIGKRDQDHARSIEKFAKR